MKKVKKITAFLSALILVLSVSVVSASAEEETAENELVQNISPTLWGDLNCDGYINSYDSRLCLRASANLETLTPEQRKAADVFGDGKIGAANARKILRVGAGLDIFDTYVVHLDLGEKFQVEGLVADDDEYWNYYYSVILGYYVDYAPGTECITIDNDYEFEKKLVVTADKTGEYILIITRPDRHSARNKVKYAIRIIIDTVINVDLKVGEQFRTDDLRTTCNPFYNWTCVVEPADGLKVEKMHFYEEYTSIDGEPLIWSGLDYFVITAEKPGTYNVYLRFEHKDGDEYNLDDNRQFLITVK